MFACRAASVSLCPRRPANGTFVRLSLSGIGDERPNAFYSVTLSNWGCFPQEAREPYKYLLTWGFKEPIEAATTGGNLEAADAARRTERTEDEV